jgi:hypothetical protein
MIELASIGAGGGEDAKLAEFSHMPALTSKADQ